MTRQDLAVILALLVAAIAIFVPILTRPASPMPPNAERTAHDRTKM